MKTLSDAIRQLRRSNDLLSEEIGDFEVWITVPLSELDEDLASNMKEFLTELARVHEMLCDALTALQDINQAQL